MKAFSELTSASQVNNGDLLAISQTSGSGYASKKTTVKDITDKSNLNLAEEYDSTSTYAVDDYVIYESVLYKCIGTTTGTFDSTKWTSVVVTDEMGSGGGGTGGHTIIDENGNSMSARAGLQFVGANVSDDGTNNKTIVDLASAGGIDGVFIDATNVIHTISDGNDSFKEWIATDDCYIIGTIKSSQSPAVQIDGITVAYLVSPSETIGVCVIAKKGQSVKYRMSAQSTLTAYGIQTGTTHSKFQPVIYSTEEREIGVWTDGKPLYQKTYVIGQGGLVIGTQWTDTGIELTDGELIINTEVIRINARGTELVQSNIDNTTNHIRFRSSAQLTLPEGSFFTIQYTKTSDTAGSGSWTPQGVPAVHYSTDEQIIGTWLGETLYQKTLHISNVQFNSTGVYDLNLTSMGTDILIADNSCSYYTFSTYVRNFEKLVPEDGHIYCYGVANRPITDGYITIKYTKSS